MIKYRRECFVGGAMTIGAKGRFFTTFGSFVLVTWLWSYIKNWGRREEERGGGVGRGKGVKETERRRVSVSVPPATRGRGRPPGSLNKTTLARLQSRV